MGRNIQAASYDLIILIISVLRCFSPHTATLREYYNMEEEDLFFSILPTATQYSRNSIFAGLMPSEIQKKYPLYIASKLGIRLI